METVKLKRLPFEAYAFQRDLIELTKRGLHKKRDEHCRLIEVARWRI